MPVLLRPQTIRQEEHLAADLREFSGLLRTGGNAEGECERELTDQIVRAIHLLG